MSTAIEVMKPEEPTAMSLLQLAVEKGANIDTIERLAKLQREIQEFRAKIAYGEAMAAAQAKIEPVRRDAKNTQTGSKYATYSALNTAIRPHYTSEGLSISYNTAESSKTDHVRVLAAVSHIAGHTEPFQVDIPVDTAGPKGNAVMTKTHATVSGISYGKRTLLKAIFDIPEFDDDGNAAGGNEIPAMDEGALLEWLDVIRASASLVDLQRIYAEGYKIAEKVGDKNAIAEMGRVKDARKAAIRAGN